MTAPRNQVWLKPLSPGMALDAVQMMFPQYAPEVAALAPQLAMGRRLRALLVNGDVFAVGGVVRLDNHDEGFLILAPDRTWPPHAAVLMVRRIAAAVAEHLSGTDCDLIVHVRTPAGARLAKCSCLRRLRKVRLHDVELEVFGHVVSQPVVRRPKPAQDRGAASAGTGAAGHGQA